MSRGQRLTFWASPPSSRSLPWSCSPGWRPSR